MHQVVGWILGQGVGAERNRTNVADDFTLEAGYIGRPAPS